MQYIKRFHKNAVSILQEKYPFMTFTCVYHIGAEMVSKAESDTIFVLSSLSDLGDSMQILLCLKYIFKQSSYLLVLDNEDISTAKIEKVSDIRYDIVPDDKLLSIKKPLTDELLKHLDDELSIYQLPANFPDYYWKYELGEIKLSDAYGSMGFSKPYFYKLCEIFENTLTYYVQQYHSSVKIIQAPKKRETNYEKMIDILAPFVNVGLTFEALSTLESELNTCWIDLWRTLLSLRKSRYYYYYLKDNPSLKKKTLYLDINTALDALISNPTVFIQMNSVQMLQYTAPKERLVSFL